MSTVKRFEGISSTWARGLVENACDKLSEEATRDYTLEEVAAEVNGRVLTDGITCGGWIVIMQRDPLWVEMGGQHSLRKQHYPVR